MIMTAGGDRIEIKGYGNVHLKFRGTKGEVMEITIPDVVYIPTAPKNLLSVKKMKNRGWRISDTDTSLLISKGGHTLEAKCEGLYYLHAEELEEPISLLSSSIEIWHNRLGHLDKNMLHQLKNQVRGMEISTKGTGSECEVCLKANMKSAPFKPIKDRKHTRVLEIVHTDILGPIATPTKFFSEHYSINFIDNYSRYTVTYQMRTKSEVLEMFKKFIRNHGTPGTVRMDNGAEYKSAKFIEFCDEKGIKREYSIEYTPQQNGIPERNNGIIASMTRAMLTQAKLPECWWGLAMRAATYVKNRTLTEGQVDGKTPFEAFWGIKPDVSHLRTFGCRAITLNTDPKRKKFHQRGLEGIFVGYGEEKKSFLIYLPDKDKIVHSRTVKFLENQVSESEAKITQLEDKPALRIPTRPENKIPVNLPEISFDKENEEPTSEQLDQNLEQAQETQPNPSQEQEAR